MVCQDYSPPEGYVPTMMNPLLDNTNCDWSKLEGINRVIVPFLACGDLNGYDTDANYQLEVSESFFCLTS